MKIDIHIEELALHGLGARQGRSFVEALRREVGRLCASDGSHQDVTARSLPRLDAGDIGRAPDGSGTAAGEAAGRAVAGVLGARSPR